MHVVVFAGAFRESGAQVAADVRKHLGQVSDVRTVQHAALVLVPKAKCAWRRKRHAWQAGGHRRLS